MDDARDLLNFVRELLRYLYEMPAELSRRRSPKLWELAIYGKERYAHFLRDTPFACVCLGLDTQISNKFTGWCERGKGQKFHFRVAKPCVAWTPVGGAVIEAINWTSTVFVLHV